MLDDLRYLTIMVYLSCLSGWSASIFSSSGPCDFGQFQTQVNNLKSVSDSAVGLANQLYQASKILNAIIYPISSQGTTNPFSVDCSNNQCPTFNWTSSDFASITKNSNSCTVPYFKLKNGVYSPFSNCSNGLCIVQGIDENENYSNCSVDNSLAGQSMPHGGYFGSENQQNNLIQVGGNYYVPTGCVCATPGKSLDYYNQKNNSGIQNPDSGTIIVECPICPDFYSSHNNVVLLKYKALYFIKNTLSTNPDLKSAVKNIINNSPLCKNSTSSSSSNSNQPVICTLNLDNILALAPRSENVRIKDYYTTATSGTGKISQSYCVLQDSNLQIDMDPLLKLLAALMQGVKNQMESIATQQNKQIPQCKDYQEMLAAQQKNKVLSLQAQLLTEGEQLTQTAEEAALLGQVNKILGAINQVLGMGMFAYMMVKSPVEKAIQKVKAAKAKINFKKSNPECGG